MLGMEIKRVWKDNVWRIGFAILFLCFAMTAFFSASNDSVSYKKYSHFNKTESVKNDISKYEKVSNYIVEEESPYFNQDSITYEEIAKELSDVINYNENIKNKLDSLQQLKSLLQLSSVKEEKISILEKEISDYSKLTHKSLEYTASFGVYKSVCFIPLFVLMAIYSIFLSARIFMMDRDNSINAFLGTMGNGRGRLFVSRIITLILFGFATFLLASILVLLVFTACFGMPAKSFWLSNVQSLAGCSGLVLELNNLTMLALFILGNTFVFFCIGLTGLAALCFGKKHKVVYVIVLCVLFAEVMTYVFIDDKSWLSSLKNYNLFSVVFWGKSWYEYGIISFFGIYMSKWFIVIIMSAIIGILSLTVCFYYFGYVELSIGKEKKHRKKRCLAKNHSLMLKEIRKLLLDYGGVIIVFFAFILGGVYASGQNIKIESISEYYYRNYVKQFSGQLNEEKEKEIYDLYKKTEEELQYYLSLGMSQGNSIYDDCTSRIEALDNLLSDVEYAQKDGSGLIIYQSAYNKLFKNPYGWMFILSESGILLLVLLVPYFVNDKKYGITELAASTSIGTKSFLKLKRKVSLVCILSIDVVLCLLYTFVTVRKFDISVLGINAVDVKALSFMPGFLSLFEILLCFAIIEIIYLVILFEICNMICKRFDSVITALLGGIITLTAFQILLCIFIL